MNPDRQQAIEYLRAPAHGLWRWAEDGAVLVWRDGSTIAFRGEIQQILEGLAPHGLPSFGALVFLLAAGRGKVPTADDILPTSQAAPGAREDPSDSVLWAIRRQRRDKLAPALALLGRVAQLPVDLHKGINARCTLAEAVFEFATVEQHVPAAAVLHGMQTPLHDADLRREESPGAGGTCVRQIHVVAEGLKRHTAESLALRFQTGLDALPEAADIVLPTAERARKLIDELSRDREAGVVARAARELMAAIRLPRRLEERDPLAVGGVADITNRGPLDRLLLSELAHDDLTLAVRVALNEALYLRREPPMREPPGTLMVLLDAGVRLWGIPRALATSVALALVACDRQHLEVRAWRASGKDLRPVDLLTRSGLLQHLAALEVDAHPGSALPALAKADAADARNQSVLITHRDALDDPEFRRALSDAPGVPGFVATVDRAGRFELHATPLAHRRALCEADLDLNSILREPKGLPARRLEFDPELPSIFGVHPFPFLMPVAVPVECWVEAGDGFTYAIVNNRRLVRFRNARSGARVLVPNLPPGRTLWMDCLDDTVHLVKPAANERPAQLVSVVEGGEAVRVTELLPGTDMRAVHRCGEVILVIREADVCAFSLRDGRMLGRRLIPYQWISGRYFRGEGQFHFVSWDGSAVQFDRLNLPAQFNGEGIVCIFDRNGFEGPWFVRDTGLIFSSTGDHQDSLPVRGSLAIDSCVASRDGHRLIWNFPGADSFQIKDLRSGKVRKAPPPTASRFLLEPMPLLPKWNIRRVVESIALLRDGLALGGQNDRWCILERDSRGGLRIRDVPMLDFTRESITSFPREPRLTRHGCGLQMVELRNGTKIFLDSRGLLHFKPARPGLAEVSLVLSEGEVAGWTSDGFVCGPDFFFEGAHTTEPGAVLERLLRAIQL